MTAPSRTCPACSLSLPPEAQFCLRCGAATPTDPDAPSRTAPTGAFEVASVRAALADRYRIDRILGEGGMATVYLAEDLKHHRPVAVKVMRRELAVTLGADRFLREVEIAARLNHPHVLPMHDSGSADGLLYYVMPYVEGESLQARLGRETQLPIEDALRLAREVAEALAHAHAQGIVHRDIKPANILLSARHALVADFGIARALGPGAGEAITQTGLAVGTPQYMSPEQATGGRDVDARADIYAVGAVLYEMIAGEPPFTGPTAQVVISRTITETPRPLSESREQVHPQVEAVVRRALARVPADRFQTADALVDGLTAALDAIRAGIVTSGATPAHPASAARAWALFAAGAALALVVAASLVGRWGLPRWTFALAIVLSAMGALMLLATGVVEGRRRRNEPVRGPARHLSWRLAAGGGGLALAGFAALSLALVVWGPHASPAGGVRLAVLPFENRGDSTESYFADGIADEIRGKLSALPGFQVTARTSSDQYRGSARPLAEIARELRVDYLLGARVRWVHQPGGQSRAQVVPELVDATSGTVKWQQSFDADVTDIFEVQGAIAARVASALGVALGATDERELGRRPTTNLAAYDLYLKGRALSGADPATVRAAVRFYEQATALDPNFADAWARLARALCVLYSNGTPDPAIASRAHEAAQRALATAGTGATGHQAMGTYYRIVLTDYGRAAEELRLAAAAAPNTPDILGELSNLEWDRSQPELALDHAELARRLDPRGIGSLSRLVTYYTGLRRPDDALAAGAELLAVVPEDLTAVEAVAMAHLSKGDLAGARRVFASVPGASGGPALYAYLATYYDLYWTLDEAEQQVLLRLPLSAFFDDPAARASVFMQVFRHRGDRDRARAYADTAVTAFDGQLEEVPADAQLIVLRALALAYLGRKAEAIAEGERGVALAPLGNHANGTYLAHQLIRIYLLLGEHDLALDRLETLLRVPYHLTPAWIRIDPDFKPLLGNPRLERILAEKPPFAS
ncbi:MAG: protein kinase [Gemmatimonadales bacterium]